MRCAVSEPYYEQRMVLKVDRIKILFIFTAFFFWGAMAGASVERGAPFDVTAEAERGEVHIGDIVKVHVQAKIPPGFEAYFPERPENTGEFSFISSEPVREAGAGAGRVYAVSIYTTGTHVLPPVTIEYWNTEGPDRGIIQSPQVPIEVRSLLSGDDKDIKDIKPLVALPVSYVFVAAVFGLFVLTGFAIWLYIWKFRGGRILAGREKAKTPYELASEELEALKAEDLPGKGLVKEYYTRLSDIIRHYIEGRFSYRAPEMTTEEFMEQVKRSPDLERANKDLLKEFLVRCDMVKFAKYGPTPSETEGSYASARNFVEQTSKEREEEE
ncbi:MAG: hypothetical protein GF408_04450 [Candidatus Omnitrophica bacterium]|nr:hypothetical protein [Candidatus Omnitrophota bacterium]